MNEIICPHCNKAFKVDEAGYADILKQVHDSEFKRQLDDRLELAEKEKLKEIELAKSNVRNNMQEAAAAKDVEIKRLEAKLEAEEVARKLAVTEAMRVVEKERKRRYLGRYFAHPMMQNRRAKRDDYKPSAALVTGHYVP
ncbi:hypothetical protein [Piscirickettsia salmonis]|uniref:hypothetical protein n=1 Tax=Piscirickettsia salmonis TaxID=1238 RepID=UPI003A80D3C8